MLSVTFYIVTESVVGLNGVAPFFPLQKSRFLIFFQDRSIFLGNPLLLPKHKKLKFSRLDLSFLRQVNLFGVDLSQTYIGDVYNKNARENIRDYNHRHLRKIDWWVC